MVLLYVAVGGALGAVARYALTGWVHTFATDTFPWGTLTVNVAGSLLLGFLFLYLESTAFTAELRQFVAIGLLGAFTTFSTFSYETWVLVQDGEWGRAAGYVAGSVGLGLLGVAAGLLLAALLLHGRT